MRKAWKSVLLTTVASSLLLANVATVLATAAPDGKTNAEDFAATINQSAEWETWKEEWQTVKNDWTQMSLTPGKDESALNFAWYSKKIDGAEYISNKVLVDGLEADTTYYYSYEKDGNYTQAVEYKTKSKDSFHFIFLGDPQIGSSNELKGSDSEEFYQAQSNSVCSDSFNWAATLNAAMKESGGKAAFVLSAGDQIQTTKKKAPNKDASKSEIEYTGYLSPDILKSLPVATTVGNHDADNNEKIDDTFSITKVDIEETPVPTATKQIHNKES